MTSLSELQTQVLNMTKETILPYILNPVNKNIYASDINDILKKYNLEYNINNVELFQTAMSHPSYCEITDIQHPKFFKTYFGIQDKTKTITPIDSITSAIPLQKKSYQLLEYFGDSVIRLSLAEYIMDRYHNCNEGIMTEIRIVLENGETLANLCKIIGLNEYVLLGRIYELTGARNYNDEILEDIFEAFIGALFLDTKSRNINSYEFCKRFIINIIEKEIDIAHKLYYEKNYKEILNQFYHKMKWTNGPKYQIIDMMEKNNSKQYVIGLLSPDHQKVICQAKHEIKKKAEQEVAKLFLYQYGELNDNDDIYEVELNSIDEMPIKYEEEDLDIVYL
jgi:dsRNA-specific ribonuclease